MVVVVVDVDVSICYEASLLLCEVTYFQRYLLMKIKVNRIFPPTVGKITKVWDGQKERKDGGKRGKKFLELYIIYRDRTLPPNGNGINNCRPRRRPTEPETSTQR